MGDGPAFLGQEMNVRVVAECLRGHHVDGK